MSGHHLHSIRTLLLCAVLVVELLAAIVLPKSISWDPSYGMLAAQHYVHSRSPDLLHIAEADRDQLGADKLIERGYWAPGYQVVPWLLRFGSFSWGAALNATIMLCLIVGFSGWALYFRRISGSAEQAAWLLLSVACARYMWLYTIVYAGGDLLLWAAAPWLVLLNLRALEPSSSKRLAFVAGGLASGVFLLKYSAIFLTAGLGLIWFYTWWRRRAPMNRLALWSLGAGAMGAGIKLLGFPASGHAATVSTHLKPAEAIFSLGFAPAGATDLEAVAARLSATFAFGGDGWRWAGVYFALLVALVAVVFVCRHHAQQTPAESHAAVILGLTDMAGLAALVFLGSNIAPQARLGRVAGLLLLPVVARVLWLAFSERRGAVRWAAGAALALLLAVPAAYGIAAGAPKLVQAWRYRATSSGPDGVACFALDATIPHDAFFREVEAKLPARDTVLLVPQAQLAFAIPQRRCIVFDAALVLPAEKIAEEQWSGVPAGGVALLLPRTYEHDPRLPVLQRTFVDLSGWQMVPLETDPQWALWIHAGSERASPARAPRLP